MLRSQCWLAYHRQAATVRAFTPCPRQQRMRECASTVYAVGHTSDLQSVAILQQGLRPTCRRRKREKRQRSAADLLPKSVQVSEARGMYRKVQPSPLPQLPTEHVRPTCQIMSDHHFGNGVLPSHVPSARSVVRPQARPLGGRALKMMSQNSLTSLCNSRGDPTG